MKLEIRFKNQSDISRFVNAIKDVPCNIDLSHGRYQVDAKSIMGIYALDISKPLTLTAYTDDKAVKEQLKDQLSEYLV